MPSHPAPPTASLLAALRRQAKLAARSGTMSHVQALDAAARQRGWPSWREMQAAAGHEAEASPAAAGLPVDPALPADFDSTPNGDRPRAQIDEWWDRPYAITLSDGRYVVRCLDGGAWDRSTNYGAADTLEEAADLARRKLAAWQFARRRPLLMVISVERNEYAIISTPDRPGLSETWHAGPMTQAEASAWMKDWEARSARPAEADPEFMGGSAKRHLSNP